jgi:non-ribosomal peptide synthetase-like protein
VIQILVTAVVNTLAGLRWLTVLATLNNLLSRTGTYSWAPTVSWWWVLGGFVLFMSPLGRMAISVAGARLLLRGVRPGTYERGGSVHVRLWAAERLAEAVGAANLAGAPWIAYYARALGAKIGRGVDVHTLPPITGMLTLSRYSSVEPEVDLSGYWVDGDVLRLGRIRVGPNASIGSRSTLGPGAQVGAGAQVDVPAAFHVSTADSLNFADGTIFKARNGSDSTLTIAPPARLGKHCRRCKVAGTFM